MEKPLFFPKMEKPLITLNDSADIAQDWQPNLHQRRPSSVSSNDLNSELFPDDFEINHDFGMVSNKL
jgi:hypothetical protein